LISERLWTKKFNSTADIIGKSITLDDKSYRVVGVIPSSFIFLLSTDVYVALGASGLPPLQNRAGGIGHTWIGRLKPGVTFEQAQADFTRIMNQLAETYPATNKGNGATLTRLKPNLVRDVQSVLLLLLGAVGFVLLIACVNVSNLMLARSTGRAREFRNSCGPRRSTMAPNSSIVGGELVALALRWNCRPAYCHLGHPGCTKSFAEYSSKSSGSGCRHSRSVVHSSYYSLDWNPFWVASGFESVSVALQRNLKEGDVAQALLRLECRACL
jgi:hypothetical protein